MLKLPLALLIGGTSVLKQPSSLSNRYFDCTVVYIIYLKMAFRVGKQTGWKSARI